MYCAHSKQLNEQVNCSSCMGHLDKYVMSIHATIGTLRVGKGIHVG